MRRAIRVCHENSHAPDRDRDRVCDGCPRRRCFSSAARPAGNPGVGKRYGPRSGRATRRGRAALAGRGREVRRSRGPDRAAGTVLRDMVPSGRRGGLFGTAGRNGDRRRSGPIRSGRSSLLLTGVAAGLVAPLGLDTLRTRPVVFGHDRTSGWARAGRHGTSSPRRPRPGPRRAVDEQCRIPGVCRVPSAEFAWRGDLWRGRRWPENPLVEYRLGRGRVVALAWRLSPHYHIAPAGYRANFEQLVKNLMAYLGDSSAPRSSVASAGIKRTVGVRPAEWRTLELAIDDLCDGFKDRYPAGREYRRRLGVLKSAHDALLRRNTPARRPIQPWSGWPPSSAASATRPCWRIPCSTSIDCWSSSAGRTSSGCR